MPPNTELRRAPLLDALVEIDLAAGDIDRARAAADELAAVATRFGSKALLAGAALAHARVLLGEGKAADAEQNFSDAARLWNEVGAPYEAAIARLGLAEALRARGNEPRATLESDAARAVLERIAVPAGVQRRPQIEGSVGSELPARERNMFRRDGDYWSVAFEDRTVRLRDLKGMRYLARLLTDPGREFHVLDLVAAEAGRPPRTGRGAVEPSHIEVGDAGEILDAKAKDAYRRRLAEIDDDLDQAAACGDTERAAQATIERDFLIQELSRAVGLAGRGRRAGSASERARAGVTRAIRQAMARIGEHHPPLGEHLDRCIRTGTYCSYQPDPRTPAAWNNWRL